MRVLDLSRGMPGAVASMIWADYGAEVTVVEGPRGGPLRRSHGHSIWNRGKRSLVADLTDSAGRETVRSLAAGADVVLEDHRPGALAALGLGYDDVAAINPDVVYTSISAYGQDGSRRGRLGYDAAVAAHLGIMSEWAGIREGPIFLGHPGIDYATAFIASIGTLAAVRARLVGGAGDHVDVSLLDGALALYTMNWKAPQLATSIDQKSSTGDLRFGYKRLLLRMYDCADDTLIQVHTGAAGAFDRAMEVFGLGDEVSKMQGNVQMSSLLTDHDLDVLDTKLPDIVRSRPRQEWLELLWANQVAALPVGQPGEALDDDQVRHAGIVTTLDDPDLGSIEVVGPSILLSASPGEVVAPAPTLDADGDSLRRDGWSSAGLEAAAGDTPPDTPLAGVRILEFATFFAAPYGDRLLSDLGAEVVKVEGVDGDPMRPLPEMFEGANRGKRAIAADLKHPAAAALVNDLVRQADVVQHNLRPGAAERLGIDVATLRAVNPDVIYHYAPGYGSSGPKSMLQSFAPLLSGFVGTFAIGAGAGNRPHGTFGNEDYYNGLVGASALLLALIHRQRTGTSQMVESPQLHSSIVTTSEYFKRDGRYESVIPRLDGGLYGWAAGYRIYQCLDAWICVTCVRDEQVQALVAAVAPTGDAAPLTPEDLTAGAAVDGPIGELLAYHFVERTADEWASLLSAAGVPCEAVAETS
ncbi:MAG: CoA transferase, partial [Ilumatobacteraceae bacterium]